MRIPVLPPLLLLCLTTCVVPVENEPWSEDTLRLAGSVEQQGEQLTTVMLEFFNPGSSEYSAARDLGAQLQQEYARQVVAWKVLEAYLSDVDIAISQRTPNAKPVHGVSRAFHELHVRLLQTSIAPSFGITVEQHKEATLRIMTSNSVLSAMEIAHPLIATMCDNLSRSCRDLVDHLAAGELVAMELLAASWHEELTAREMLIERQARLRNAMAMLAAGAGETSGDPAADLVEVERLLENNDEWYLSYTAQRRELSETFRAHADFARKSSHAVLEWGIGHRELVKAIKRGDNHANLRLFNASVRELAD